MKLFIRLVSALMICVLLFCCSPMRAEAAIAETVFLFGIPVIMALIIGIGLKPDTTTGVAFNNVVNDCFEAIKATGEWIVDGDQVELRTQMVDGYTRYYADAALVEAVQQWLVDQAIIRKEPFSTYGAGFVLTGEQGEEFWQDFDLFTAVNSSTTGHMPLCIGGSAFLCVSLLDFNEFCMVCLSNTESLSPYTSESLMVGSFVDNSYAYSLSTSFVLLRNKEEALYYWDKNGGDVYFLCEDSSVVPNYSTRNVNFHDVGLVSSSGLISSGETLYHTLSYAFVDSPILVPSDYSEDGVFGSSIGASGYIADPSLTISQGYPAWVQNAVTEGEVTYLPLGMSGSLDSTAGLTQEQIWSGSAFSESPIISTQDYEYQLSYELGATPKPLFAKAYSPDGGKLTYQWYVDAFPIAGAQTAVYYPPTTEVGIHEYTCLVGNVTTTEMAASYAWTWPVKVTVGVDADVDVEVDALPDQIADSITDVLAGERVEAELDGNSAVNDVLDIIPDYSFEFTSAYSALTSVLNHEDTEAYLMFPAIKVPGLLGLFDTFTLNEPCKVDFEDWFNKMPEDLLRLIRALFDISIVGYSVKEFMELLAQIANGFNKAVEE